MTEFNWKKVGLSQKGAPKKNHPRVGRSKASPNIGYLTLPALDDDTPGRFDIYESHDFLGLHFVKNGTHKLYEAQKRVTIPKRFALRFPFGTTPCEVTRNGEMWVLDLKQFELEDELA